MLNDKVEKEIPRRYFLYSLGGLGGFVIGGWVLGPNGGSRARRIPVGGPGVGIGLRSGLAISPMATGALIYDLHSNDTGQPACAVNRIGLQILWLLDGKRTVAEIARVLMEEMDNPPADIEVATTGVAGFLAELGSAGLLNAPFRANIFSREISA